MCWRIYTPAIIGFTDNAVVSHAYFGTRAVIDDLARLLGWHSGLVSLDAVTVQRDSQTRRVCGLSGDAATSLGAMRAVHGAMTAHA